MRKLVMVVALTLCMGLLVGGVVELDLFGDVQAQVKKKPPKKKKARCGTPSAVCDVSGRDVRCHGCVYDSLDCAMSTGLWNENQCRDVRRPAKKKAPPKKKR